MKCQDLKHLDYHLLQILLGTLKVAIAAARTGILIFFFLFPQKSVEKSENQWTIFLFVKKDILSTATALLMEWFLQQNVHIQ